MNPIVTGVTSLSFQRVSINAIDTNNTFAGVGSGGATTGTGNTISIDINGSGSFTEGSVVFSGPGGSFDEDNANFFWDNTNKRLSLGGSIIPTNTLTVHGSSYFEGNISQVGIGSIVALAAGTFQLSALSTGIAHVGATGIISSSAVNLAGADVVAVLGALNGGTGIANAAGSTITLGGAVVTQGKLNLTGAFDATFTLTNTTSVTFPTSGTLLSTANPSGNYVSSITGTANQVIASAATGAVTLSLPQSIATSSSPSFFSVICSGGSSNAFQAFTSSASTSPLTTLASLLMRNSNNTANNWMTVTFLDNSGSVSALIGAQCISANVNTDLVFYA